MGIDNEAKIVFGSLLGYDDMLKVIKSFMETEEEQDEDFQNFYYEKLDSYDAENRFTKKYKGISLGMCSPYFDCDFGTKTFYVSIDEDGDFSIEQSEKLISGYKSTDYFQFLQDYSFDYGEPHFIAIVNVS